MTEEKFYNPQKMLSYNQFINLIIGGRGIGKTFGMKKHLLRKHINTGKQFIYLRRNKSELDRIDKEKFFTTELLNQVFTDFKVLDVDTSSQHYKMVFHASNTGQLENIMKISASKIILNGRIVCYMKSLSTWVDLKGSEYDDVDDILFDELLIDTASRKQYLKNEVASFLNFLFSVFRRRKNCHAYLLSNATNFNNPYFAYLKFYDTSQSKRFYNFKSRAFLIEFPPNTPLFDDDDKENPFFKLINGSNAYGSMINNEFQVKNDNNIQKIKGDKTRLYSFYLDGTFLTCYYVNKVVYVSKGYDKNLNAFTILLDDVENGFRFLQKNSNVAKQIKKNYLANIIVYEDLETKNKFMEVVNYVI